MGSGPLEGEPPATELWQRVLVRLTPHLNLDVWHPLDKVAVVQQLRNLYEVGERPGVSELGAYLDQLWPGRSSARRRVTKIWRSILANPNIQFRLASGAAQRAPFTLVRQETERLTRESGTNPLSWRAFAALDRAVDELQQVSMDQPDLEEYLRRERDVRLAVTTIRRVREEMLGPESVGARHRMNVDDYTEEQVREWTRLKKRYA